MTHYCRHCGSPLHHEVIDLGHQPPSNAYLTTEQLALPEINFPLKVYLCSSCWLMQVPAHAAADELFTADYAYFSSTSKSWCEHAKAFASKAINRLKLDSDSFVVELASNDGYLLQYFQEIIKITKNMEKESIIIQMVLNSKEIIRMERGMD